MEYFSMLPSTTNNICLLLLAHYKWRAVIGQEASHDTKV
jgi:hypothetical protein